MLAHTAFKEILKRLLSLSVIVDKICWILYHKKKDYVKHLMPRKIPPENTPLTSEGCNSPPVKNVQTGVGQGLAHANMCGLEPLWRWGFAHAGMCGLEPLWRWEQAPTLPCKRICAERCPGRRVTHMANRSPRLLFVQNVVRIIK